MHIDHDVPNKIISVSQTGYIDTIMEKFRISQLSNKSHDHKIPISSGDLFDDNPIPLTKSDQSIYANYWFCFVLINPFQTRYFLSRQQFVFIYEVCISESFEFG